MAKNLVNKEKLQLILELYKKDLITLDNVTILLEDTFEPTVWTYPPYYTYPDTITFNTNQENEKTNEA